MILDAIVSVGSLIFPPVFDFIKKKFLKNEDTPEATLSTLATTKPEVLPQYTASLASYLDAQTKFFNRDVIGEPSRWIIDFRASIRPAFVALAIISVLIDIFYAVNIDPSLKLFMETTIGSWFGDRLVRK
jgi:hypothetical protein